jgi:hypothetical protein
MATRTSSGIDGVSAFEHSAGSREPTCGLFPWEMTRILLLHQGHQEPGNLLGVALMFVDRPLRPSVKAWPPMATRTIGLVAFSHRVLPTTLPVARRAKLTRGPAGSLRLKEPRDGPR